MNTFNTNPEEYDLVVLGSGAGGKLIAWTSAQKGQRVVVIERKYVGGSVPEHRVPAEQEHHPQRQGRVVLLSQRGVRDQQGECSHQHGSRPRAQAEDGGGTWWRCISTSTRRAARSSSWVRAIRWSQDHRSRAERRRDAHVPRSKCRHQHRLAGHARPIPGLAEAGPLTHIEALELDQIPKHLLVLGGGYVGLELAQAFRRFGAEVTMIDRNGRLAHHEDEDISQGVEELCRDEGINVVTNATVTRVEGKSGESIRLLGTRDGVELSRKERTCWSPEGARQTPTASGWKRREWRRRSGATSR